MEITVICYDGKQCQSLQIENSSAELCITTTIMITITITFKVHYFEYIRHYTNIEQRTVFLYMFYSACKYIQLGLTTSKAQAMQMSFYLTGNTFWRLWHQLKEFSLTRALLAQDPR